uniref:Uncharacterized protein n=1 Tax=Oryza brachyantha TaxID=4533 RepID=J3MK64_ORYBR
MHWCRAVTVLANAVMYSLSIYLIVLGMYKIAPNLKNEMLLDCRVMLYGCVLSPLRLASCHCREHQRLPRIFHASLPILLDNVLLIRLVAMEGDCLYVLIFLSMEVLRDCVTLSGGSCSMSASGISALLTNTVFACRLPPDISG